MNGEGKTTSAVTGDPARRLKPRLIDADWLVMRDLARAIADASTKVSAPGKVAVDFGCGTMPYRPIFSAAGCRYLGADLDGAPDIAITAEGALDAADASADMLLSFQVLEHVRDLAPYFAEARRVLKADGRMILSTHGTWLYHPHPEDHRRWTREGLIHEIENFGFTVTECIAVVGPLAWTTVLRLTCWCYVLKRIPIIGGAVASLMAVVMNARALIEDAVTPVAIKRDNACVYVVIAEPTPGAS